MSRLQDLHIQGGKLALVLARFTLIGEDINFTEIYGDKICQTDPSSTVLLEICRTKSLFVFIISLAIIFSLFESRVIKGFYREFQKFIVITIYWFKELTKSQLYSFVSRVQEFPNDNIGMYNLSSFSQLQNCRLIILFSLAEKLLKIIVAGFKKM